MVSQLLRASKKILPKIISPNIINQLIRFLESPVVAESIKDLDTIDLRTLHNDTIDPIITLIIKYTKVGLDLSNIHFI